MTSATRLTIVIPCFNEAKNIPLILDRFREVATRGDIKLLLVNNGSLDDSADVLEREVAKFDFAESLLVPVNQGYGYGILQGLAALETEYVGWTHADMQTDPKDIVSAMEVLEKNNYPQNVYVKGQRRGRPLSDSFFTGGMSMFESIYLGTPLWDINGQPNIFHRSFFKSWISPPHDFALDLFAYYTAMKQGLKMVRIDVRFPERLHGHSSWNTGLRSKIKFIVRTLDFSVRLKKTMK